jgi:hypothetical protein
MDAFLEKFLYELDDEDVSDLDVVQEYISFGIPYIFQGNESLYFDLKRTIANHFTLSPQEIIVVGSAKLGFSIAPQKLFKKFDDDSDIDVVIISEELFEVYWKELLDFNINTTARTTIEDNMYQEFIAYLFKGWLRPDKFPFSYKGKQEWFDFFNSISYRKYGQNKVTCAIFKNYYFFEFYHKCNINNIRKTRRLTLEL